MQDCTQTFNLFFFFKVYLGRARKQSTIKWICSLLWSSQTNFNMSRQRAQQNGDLSFLPTDAFPSERDLQEGNERAGTKLCAKELWSQSSGMELSRDD